MVRIIGITGGSGSGKTTIVRKLGELAPEFQVIPQDNYYKSASYVDNENITAFNFDHPSAFDTDLLIEHLSALKNGEAVNMPTYDFVHHRRAEAVVPLEPRRLVVLEGIMVFTDPRIRDLLDLKIYVDTPDDIRFIRRMQRDINERGRTIHSVVEQYMEVVRPGHFAFIEPQKAWADLIIPEGGANGRALDVLSSFMAKIGS